MATNSIDSKRFSVRQIQKKSSTSSSSKSVPPPPTIISTNTIITRKEVQPTPRIVVVRTTNENGETNESEPAKSVQLPPVLTNGRTSVYLIRRPIPSLATPKPTQFFQPSDDTEETEEIHPSSNTSSQLYSENPKHLVSSIDGSQSKNRSKSSIQRISPTLSIKEDSKDTGRKRRYFSFSETKSIAVQADLLKSETSPIEKRISRNKSSVNHHHQPKIAVVENSHVRRNTITPVLTHSKSFREDTDNKSTEEFIKTSGRNTCLNCLSKYILLIIIICVIFILIGLAGVGISAYFLATDSQTNLPAKIVGIVIGSVLTLATLCFLLCVLLCICCNNDDSYTDDLRSSRSSMIDQRNDNISGKNSKNIIIEMPEHLLIGRNLSAKSHKLKLNKVVTTIGHVVEDAKKHHNNQLPTKVIIKVDKKF